MSGSGAGRPAMSLLIGGLTWHGIKEKSLILTMRVLDGPKAEKGREAKVAISPEEQVMILLMLLESEHGKKVIDAMCAEQQKIDEEIASGDLGGYGVDMLKKYHGPSRLSKAGRDALKEDNAEGTQDALGPAGVG